MANPKGNPQNLRPAPPWKPGQSGNPAGRPKSRIGDTLKTLFGKSARKIYHLTAAELDEWDAVLISLNDSQLKALIQLDSVPSYPKNQAVAILTDMKNGRTTTVERLADRLYNRHNPKRVELTGKDGADLVAPRVLTKEEAAAFLDKLNEEF